MKNVILIVNYYETFLKLIIKKYILRAKIVMSCRQKITLRIFERAVFALSII